MHMCRIFPPRRGGGNAAALKSIEQVSLVEFNFVGKKQARQLSLEIIFLVMHGLRREVILDDLWC